MVRIIISIAFFAALQAPALADLRGFPSRLDHALWPGQWDPKFVVAGEIVSTESRKLTFRVDAVILGDGLRAGKTIPVQNGIVWPQTYVPYRKGEFCILVLGRPKRDPSADFWVSAVVPGRHREYRHARDYSEARDVLAEELIGELQDEKSGDRQRLMLLQLAPVLGKSGIESIERRASSENPAVRRAAVAALIYATEDPKYTDFAANDIQGYFSEMRSVLLVDVVNESGFQGQRTPQHILLETYFFLEPRTWTWGSMWNEAEANKHRLLRDGILESNVVEKSARKWLIGD